MDQRIVDRVVASYEAEIRSLKAAVKAKEDALSSVWSCLNRVINSQRCDSDQYLAQSLERTRDLVGEKMGR